MYIVVVAYIRYAMFSRCIILSSVTVYRDINNERLCVWLLSSVRSISLYSISSLRPQCTHGRSQAGSGDPRNFHLGRGGCSSGVLEYGSPPVGSGGVTSVGGLGDEVPRHWTDAVFAETAKIWQFSTTYLLILDQYVLQWRDPKRRRYVWGLSPPWPVPGVATAGRTKRGSFPSPEMFKANDIVIHLALI